MSEDQSPYTPPPRASKSASIADMASNIRHAALIEAELVAGACPSSLPAGVLEPTPSNRRIWAIAHAAGVMAACRAIHKLHDEKDGCGNG